VWDIRVNKLLQHYTGDYSSLLKVSTLDS